MSNVTSLKGHRTKKAIEAYVDALGGIVAGERGFFAAGKFAPFAASYLGSGRDPRKEPIVEVEVAFRDYRPGAAAKALKEKLKRDGFTINAATRWAKGCRPKAGSTTRRLGGYATKRVTIDEAKRIFAAREASPYGAYQESQSGFRNSTVEVWDENGLGFSLTCSGYDGRRGDKYGNTDRFETHVVDDDADMAELSEAFAAIRRSQIGSVA